jgi:hypothetical protein
MGQYGTKDRLNVDAQWSGDHRDAVWIRSDLASEKHRGIGYRQSADPGCYGRQDSKGSRRAEEAQYQRKFRQGMFASQENADDSLLCSHHPQPPPRPLNQLCRLQLRQMPRLPRPRPSKEPIPSGQGAGGCRTQMARSAVSAL